MVLVYNAHEGLTALDVYSGAARWTLPGANLGAGICWATDGAGNAYIGGYYGPDPVAIDARGNVKWRSDSQGSFWLYRIDLNGGELVCRYDAMDGDPDRAGAVIFDLNGNLIRKVYD